MSPAKKATEAPKEEAVEEKSLEDMTKKELIEVIERTKMERDAARGCLAAHMNVFNSLKANMEEAKYISRRAIEEHNGKVQPK